MIVVICAVFLGRTVDRIVVRTTRLSLNNRFFSNHVVSDIIGQKEEIRVEFHYYRLGEHDYFASFEEVK